MSRSCIPAKLALLGVGAIEPAAMAVSALASYFGERPMQVAVFDPSAERRDLVAQLARTCFDAMRSSHQLIEASSGSEALEGATHALLIASRDLGYGRCGFEPTFMGEILTVRSWLAPSDRPFHSTDWPSEADLAPWSPSVAPHPAWVAHQLLRWIRGDETVKPLLDAAATSPVRAWLNGDRDPRITLIHEA